LTFSFDLNIQMIGFIDNLILKDQDLSTCVPILAQKSHNLNLISEQEIYRLNFLFSKENVF